jgi:glyoxylase-like metal-dependent hydrolase (beta-lactamase superfamily II)
MIHTSRGGDLAEYIASLERVLTLEPRVLLPAHGPRIDEPRRVLTGYLEHRRLRERQVIASLARGPATVQAIAEYIYDGLDPALMPAARENVRAHLEKLKTDGVALTDESDRWMSAK